MQEFIAAFLKAYGYDEEALWQVKIDEELTMEYPVALIALGQKRIVLLCPEIEEAVQEIQYEHCGDIAALTSFLFDEQVGFTYQNVIGAYYDKAAAIAPDPRVRKLTRADAPSLKALLKACTPEERRLAAVSMGDDLLLGFYEGQSLLGAVGGVKTGQLMDLSVIVHPGARKKGVGAALVRQFCAVCLGQGDIPLYRHEQDNAASQALREKIGFTPAYILTGACAHYPQ